MAGALAVPILSGVRGIGVISRVPVCTAQSSACIRALGVEAKQCWHGVECGDGHKAVARSGC